MDIHKTKFRILFISFGLLACFMLISGQTTELPPRGKGFIYKCLIKSKQDSSRKFGWKVVQVFIRTYPGEGLSRRRCFFCIYPGWYVNPAGGKSTIWLFIKNITLIKKYMKNILICF